MRPIKPMFKRIFLKYFTICASIILAILMVMGVLSSAVMASQTITQTARDLESAAIKLSSLYAEMPKNGYFVGGKLLGSAMDVVKGTLEADILILTDSGLVAAATVKTSSPQAQDVIIPSDALSTVLGGKIYRKDGAFLKANGRHPAYTVGAPIMIGDNQIAGAVFVTTTQVGLWEVLVPFLLIYLLFVMLALIIAFIIVYFVTLKMFYPLMQMSQAAKRYAEGDFSMRITVRHEDELGELGLAFNNMADSLDKLETMRQGFVEDVSHELRTPMTTISGFIDGILDGVIEPEDQKKYLTIVSEEIKRLSRMVSSMLDVARVQAGTMAFSNSNFELGTILKKNLDTLSERFTEKGVNLVVDIAPEQDFYVYADADSVYRVIYNLLDNAAKFVNENGSVILRMKRSENMVLTSVYNTGEGISQKDVGHVFDRFYKTDKSRSKNTHGVGIGLYLVRNIVRAMGGDIFVSSKEGEYVEFTFSLPAAKDI